MGTGRFTDILVLDGQDVMSHLRELVTETLGVLQTRTPLQDSGSHSLAKVLITPQTVVKLESGDSVGEAGVGLVQQVQEEDVLIGNAGREALGELLVGSGLPEVAHVLECDVDLLDVAGGETVNLDASLVLNQGPLSIVSARALLYMRGYFQIKNEKTYELLLVMLVLLIGRSELEEPVNSLHKVDTVGKLAGLQSTMVSVVVACEELTTWITRKDDAIVHIQAWDATKSHTMTGDRSRG